MKKFLIGAVAAIIATAGFVSTANAERYYHHHGWRGHHYAYGHRHHYRPHVSKRVVIRNGCMVRTVKRVDSHGNTYIKRVRSC